MIYRDKGEKTEGNNAVPFDDDRTSGAQPFNDDDEGDGNPATTGLYCFLNIPDTFLDTWHLKSLFMFMKDFIKPS